MSAPASVHVTELEYDTTDAGAEVKVTARRVGAGWFYSGPQADAADLPPDVADALRAWLTNAPTQVQA